MGKTDSSGHYEIFYVGHIKGSMLGRCRVSITKQIPDPKYRLTAKEQKMLEAGEFSIPFVELVPKQYWGASSALAAEVSDTENVFNFDLVSK